MSGFYFSSIPKLKIRRRGVVDNISSPPQVPSTAPFQGLLFYRHRRQWCLLLHVGPAPLSENSRQSGKRKAETGGREGAFRTLVPPLVECINIGFRRDELNPTILGKLPAPAAIATASVHKYWTSAFEKAADNTELMELLKLAEMYTSRSHVLNCELYKVLVMKVDELHSTVGGDKDVNALRSENKDLRE
ncbi:hypothetical protein Fot_42624 [Forsythia ovata]|uniref:Uncharacterized protein n=1 Tax=Forsythia ovata TaxID=205694 RepID=A0ABD1RLQ1_9LAMI